MPKTAVVRVLIVDANSVVRRGLRIRLDHADDIDVIGEASTAEDAVAVARAEQVDVVVMDPQMSSGLNAVRALTETDAEHGAYVVVLTNQSANTFVFDALRCGAAGYLLKTHDADDLIATIRLVAAGKTVLSTYVTLPVLRDAARLWHEAAHQADAPSTGLSQAEINVVAQLSCGITTDEGIAALESVSVETVRTQLASALEKTRMVDRTQLAEWGVRHGLDRP